MKHFIIGSGWKMNNTIKESLALIDELEDLLGGFDELPLYVLPSFTALAAVGERLRGRHIKFGAQNMHWAETGAYTGEVSAAMLTEVGCSYVELNHHERRTLFGETNETTNKKIHTALRHGLMPILCVGEEERLEEAEAFRVLTLQLEELLAGVEAKDAAGILYAYEPRWAIGKTAAAPPDYINWIHGLFRKILGNMYSPEIAEASYILYGGSVNKDNAMDIARKDQVNGLFIGRAGLDAASFAEIILNTVIYLRRDNHENCYRGR
ncbi:MAG: triose-phosphate isomerase [Negativicutes bacterium]|nr:triose-phosphate isomerase [Negativicutes bacterium]